MLHEKEQIQLHGFHHLARWKRFHRRWVREKTPESKDETKKDSSGNKKAAQEVLSKVNFPFGDFGRAEMPQLTEWVLIKNATLWTLAALESSTR